MFPAVEEMLQFENDLLLLINNPEFINVHDDFQMRLRSDLKQIKVGNKMFVSADYSRDICKMERDD